MTETETSSTRPLSAQNVVLELAASLMELPNNPEEDSSVQENKRGQLCQQLRKLDLECQKTRAQEQQRFNKKHYPEGTQTAQEKEVETHRDILETALSRLRKTDNEWADSWGWTNTSLTTLYVLDQVYNLLANQEPITIAQREITAKRLLIPRGNTTAYGVELIEKMGDELVPQVRVEFQEKTAGKIVLRYILFHGNYITTNNVSTITFCDNEIITTEETFEVKKTLPSDLVMDELNYRQSHQGESPLSDV
jgi:hypothetical protein